ncbi:MAG: HAD-IIA family hydrolase [Oscillospiraceae bacterium]|nr:HAD-IIA family hydrolase [Oscillospiraceae bacterium]
MHNPPLTGKKLFLLDMDGTIYLDEQLFDGTVDFLNHVRKIGGRYLFLTNNSSRSVEAYIEKMQRLGIPTTADDYLTSVDALIVWLNARGYREKLLYAFGTASFRKQLADAGFRTTQDRDAAVDALICGFDTELTFQKLEDACILLNRGVDFIAANPDWVCPTWYGYVPDCGSVCEMLFRATGRRPVFIGKPEPDMALLAMEKYGFSREETLLIGDRVYTDIACGVRAGIDAALVLSGESTLKDVERSSEKPTHIYEDIRALLNDLIGERTS